MRGKDNCLDAPNQVWTLQGPRVCFPGDRVAQWLCTSTWPALTSSFDPYQLRDPLTVFFLKNFCIFGGAGPSLLCAGGAHACSSFFCCGTWSLGQGSVVGAHTGLVAPQHVGSSWIRDRILVRCIGRQTLKLLDHQGSPLDFSNPKVLEPLSEGNEWHFLGKDVMRVFRIIIVSVIITMLLYYLIY